jgi:hypothetical protein
MSRGNGRQDIMHHESDRKRFEDLLGGQVDRSRWELISFVLVTNHFHS